jgi:hypothetical protein
MAKMSVHVPPWAIRVAKATEKGENAPTYEAFIPEYRLQVNDVFTSSSVVGQSYARLTLATGLPHSPQVAPEDSEDILHLGDRVMLGMPLGGKNYNWIFSGYVTTIGIHISSRAERMTYQVTGPEWLLGSGNESNGAQWQIAGQFRRDAGADEAWAKKPSTITRYDEWDNYYGEPAIFNPGGLRNMTTTDVEITPSGSRRQHGRIWETPERRVSGTLRAAHWTIKDAAKILVTQYNPEPFSGIVGPIDWDDETAIPFTDKDILPETDVTGLGLWEALRRVLGPKYFFSISPRAERADWSGFQLRFHSRSAGASADIRLNRRGTSMHRAAASCVRLESTRKISDTVNSGIVYGRDLKGVRLIYWGGSTPGLSGKLRKTALQQAWSDTQGRITDYSFAGVLNPITIDRLSAETRKQWLERYVTSGAQHLKYLDTFRRFSWNEGAEFPAEWGSTYGSAYVVVYSPDLTGIVDDPDRPGKYVRRRRAPFDSLFLSNDQVSELERVRPTVYMAIAPSAADRKSDSWTWRKMPESSYEIDAIRCAFRITVDDLSAWKPFIKQDKPGTAKPVQDDRSFATLMASGVLRLCLECSVETDAALVGWAPRTNDSGAGGGVFLWGVLGPPAPISMTTASNRLADCCRLASI